MPLRRLRIDPSLVPGPIDDRDLDVLDRHRISIDAHDTGGFTWCRAQPASELREVVGCVQPLQRLIPVTTPHQVVPLRYEIAQRAACVAERDSTVHATAG